MSAAGIPCPICRAEESSVTDSRAGKFDTIRRRRTCANGHRYTTLETAEVTQANGGSYLLTPDACHNCASRRLIIAKAIEVLSNA